MQGQQEVENHLLKLDVAFVGLPSKPNAIWTNQRGVVNGKMVDLVYDKIIHKHECNLIEQQRF